MGCGCSSTVNRQTRHVIVVEKPRDNYGQQIEVARCYGKKSFLTTFSKLGKHRTFSYAARLWVNYEQTYAPKEICMPILDMLRIQKVTIWLHIKNEYNKLKFNLLNIHYKLVRRN